MALTWTQQTRLSTSSRKLIRHGGGKSMVFSPGSDVAMTVDGVTWTYSSPPVKSYNDAAYGDGVWIIATQAGLMRSTDGGITWFAVAFSESSAWAAIHYADGAWLRISDTRYVGRSLDGGQTWESAGYQGGLIAQPTAISRHAGQWLIGGAASKVITSPDGLTWTLRSNPDYGTIGKFVIGGGVVVAAGGNTQQMNFPLHSANGTSWAVGTGYPLFTNVMDCARDLQFYVASQVGTVLRSADGAAWTSAAAHPSGQSLLCIATQGQRVATLAWGLIMLSEDGGVTWTNEPTPEPGPYPEDWKALAYVGDVLVAISVDGYLYTAESAPVVPTTGWPVEIVPAPELRASTAWPVAVATAQQAATGWPVQVLDAAAVAGLDGAGDWAAAPDGRWEAVVWLGADNISTRVLGTVSVQIEADAARTAEFAFLPAAPIQPLGLIGQRVRIAFAQAGGLNAQTIFRGVVDTPTIDLQTGVISCACHDQAQEVWTNTPRATIDALVGGRWHVAVSGEPEDNFDYLRERIQSVGASWALDASSAPRILPWASPARTVTVRQADVIDGSLAVDLPSREQLRTRVDVRMQYRYPVHRGRGISAQWAEPLSFFLPRITETLTKQAYIMPDVGMVESAADNPPGWERVSLEIENPPSGTWNIGTELEPAIYNISQLVAPSLAIGFSGTYRARWQQIVTEDYSITVLWDALEAQIGQPVGEEIGATLESEFDAAGWGADPSVEPQINVLGVGDVSLPYYARGAAPADRDAVLRTLLDRAWVRLWSASRTGRVRFALPCRPDLWLDTGCILEGGRVRASGVIVALEHVLDVEGGQATTDIDVAVGMPGATPAAMPVWSLPASPYTPALPSLDQLSATIGTYVGGLESSPPFDADTMIGLVTNEDGAEVPGRNYYPVGLTIGWPDLTAADRDPRELAAAAVVSVAVPTDTLEIL